VKRAAVAVATILISTAALGAFHFAAGDRGWFMFQEGRTQEAAEAWREALAEAEKSGDRASVADAWSNIARASARAGDLAGAIHAAEEAVRATDVHDLAWFDRSARLAGLYHQAGRSDDAEDVWRDLISRYTGQSDADRDRRGQALFELGRLYHEVKRYADAEQAYLRSIATLEPLQARPFSEFALEGLALLYESLERFEDAHEACGRRLEASRALERPRDQQDAIAADCLRLGIERINPVEGRLPQHRVEGMCSSVLPKSQGEGAFYTTVFDGVPVTTGWLRGRIPERPL
jgi:tetratricopeptide (TPR) repeat protein